MFLCPVTLSVQCLHDRLLFVSNQDLSNTFQGVTLKSLVWSCSAYFVIPSYNIICSNRMNSWKNSVIKFSYNLLGLTYTCVHTGLFSGLPLNLVSRHEFPPCRVSLALTDVVIGSSCYILLLAMIFYSYFIHSDASVNLPMKHVLFIEYYGH